MDLLDEDILEVLAGLQDDLGAQVGIVLALHDQGSNLVGRGLDITVELKKGNGP